MKKDALREWMKNYYVDGCESPIESMLATALVHAIGFDMWERADCLPDGQPVTPMVALETQWECDGYRIDIVLLGHRGGARVAIECDGHEFHEKTKEQAARDKARDRTLAANGWRVLRFTGAEIWSNPFACAEEAMQVVREMESSAAEIAYLATKGAAP